MKVTLEIEADGEILAANIDGVPLKLCGNLRESAFKEGYLNGILTFHLLRFERNKKLITVVHTPDCRYYCPAPGHAPPP